jgi:hypothetical protein
VLLPRRFRATFRPQVFNETQATLALARVLLSASDTAARAETEAALDRVMVLAADSGAKAVVPRVHEQRAELARLNGDEARHDRELREAHRLYAEIGATGHAERLSAVRPAAAN